MVRGRPSQSKVAALFSIRWDYRCVRGCGSSLRQLSVMRSLPAGVSWAPWLCFVWTWWGIFDSGSAVGKQTRTCLGVGDYFFPPRSSLNLAPTFFHTGEILGDMVASDWAVYYKVDVFIWPFIQEVHPLCSSCGIICMGMLLSAQRWLQPRNSTIIYFIRINLL